MGVGVLGCGVVGSALVGAWEPSLDLVAVAVRDTGRPRPLPAGTELVGDARAVVEDPRVTVIVELLGGIEPARELIERALHLGKPVVTANKAVLGAHGPRLRRLARGRQVPLLYEAAVGAGVPVLRALRGLVAGDCIRRIDGVLNATTTWVLTHMEATGAGRDEALAEARRLGYAEADASRDLDGRDAADKLAILVHEAFGDPLCAEDIPRTGIDVLEAGDLAAARRRGRRWRLVARATRDGCALVEPIQLPLDHPLAQTRDAGCAVVVVADRAGACAFAGPGAGGAATASAVFADLALATAAYP